MNRVNWAGLLNLTAILPSRTMASSLHIWWQLCRPKTLSLALAAILAGHGLALQRTELDWLLLLLALSTALGLQVVANMANDLGDGLKGTDGPGRLGPERLFQAGRIRQRTLIRGLSLAALISLGLGAATLWRTQYANLGLWLLGGLALWAALAYTLGRKPYGYLGLGDLMVALFFGPVAVLGSLWLQTGQWQALDALASLTMALLAVGVLNLNNLRDLKSDATSGKRTLALRLGERRARQYQWWLLIAAVLTSIGHSLLVLKGYSLILALGWLLLCPGFARAFAQAHGQQLNPLLARQGLLALTYSLCLMLANFI